MLVILKRIGDDASLPDIQGFLQPALEGSLFKRSGQIESIKIQMHAHKSSEKVEYHAVVDVTPDGVAERVVKSLNRKPCKGKPINVTPYVTRLLMNDRRHNRAGSESERRRGDRRANDLIVKDVTKEWPLPKQAPVVAGPVIEWY